MADKVELTVRQAAAYLDGDAAKIALVTDQGKVTLRMHRLELGALGGAIARAMWPKAGEPVPTPPELDETEVEPSAALTDEPSRWPTQSRKAPRHSPSCMSRKSSLPSHLPTPSRKSSRPNPSCMNRKQSLPPLWLTQSRKASRRNPSSMNRKQSLPLRSRPSRTAFRRNPNCMSRRPSIRRLPTRNATLDTRSHSLSDCDRTQRLVEVGLRH
jgi:hypothetical protein